MNRTFHLPIDVLAGFDCQQCDPQFIRGIQNSEPFVPSRFAGKNGDVSTWDFPMFRQESNKVVVGLALDRRGLDADFQGIADQPGNTITRSARNHPHIQNDASVFFFETGHDLKQ